MSSAVRPALLMLLLCGRADALAPYASAEGGFTVGFPSAPQVAHASLDTPSGKAPFHLFAVELPDGLFLVSYGDYPDEGGMTASQRLHQVVDGQIAARGGTLLYKKPCALGRAQGIEASYRAATAEGAPRVSTARSYLRGTRVYQVAVVTTPGGMAAERVRSLLDSFRITDGD